MKDQQRVRVAERHIEVRVQLLGFALELALPFRAGGAGLATAEAEGFLPHLGFDPVQRVAGGVGQALDDAVVLVERGDRGGRGQLAHELGHLLDPQVAICHLEPGEELRHVGE